MSWIAYVFIGALSFSGANIIDSHLTGRIMKRPLALAFYSFWFYALLLPLVALFRRPEFPPVAALPYFFLIGVCEVAYLYPYYKALQSDDTANVISLFSIGRIFVPLLAFLIVSEVIRPIQYVGFFLVMAASFLLTIGSHRGSFRLNRSLWFMVAASLIVSLEIVIYKYLLATVSWSTGTVWGGLAGAAVSLLLLAIPAARKDIVSEAGTFFRKSGIFIAEAFFTLGGLASYLFAAVDTPISVVTGIAAAQPFLILVIALIFSPFFPKFFKEKVDLRSLVKKFGLFALTAIGIYLIAG